MNFHRVQKGRVVTIAQVSMVTESMQAGLRALVLCLRLRKG